MELFLDSSKKEEIQRWAPVIDGITTNPSILLKDGSSIDDIIGLLPNIPISIEATGDFRACAREYARKGPNVVVKVPLLRPGGGDNLSLISELSGEGISINCTALFSLGQVILAAKAGSRYVSLFGGRVDDEGGDWGLILKDCIEFLRSRFGTDCRLIVGSIRTVGMISTCVRYSADIVTVPPDVLKKMLIHARSRETVEQFEEDSKKVR